MMLILTIALGLPMASVPNGIELFRLGEKAMSKGNYELAIDLYRESLGSNELNPEAMITVYWNIISVYRKLDDSNSVAMSLLDFIGSWELLKEKLNPIFVEYFNVEYKVKVAKTMLDIHWMKHVPYFGRRKEDPFILRDKEFIGIVTYQLPFCGELGHLRKIDRIEKGNTLHTKVKCSDWNEKYYFELRY